MSTKPQADTPDAVLRRVAGAGRRRATAQAGLDDATRDLVAALSAGREVGVTWAALAEAAGIDTPQNAQALVRRVAAGARPPAVRKRSGQPNRKRESDEPGVTITDAAAHYGVGRPLIYAWVEAMCLPGVSSLRTRRLRVMSDGPDPRPLWDAVRAVRKEGAGDAR